MLLLGSLAEQFTRDQLILYRRAQCGRIRHVQRTHGLVELVLRNHDVVDACHAVGGQQTTDGIRCLVGRRFCRGLVGRVRRRQKTDGKTERGDQRGVANPDCDRTMFHVNLFRVTS
ncbi:hypothetical protein R69608_07960 [Paraburkholderia nemoris]|nr:hypothetical protein R69608_07960 [Paraburkholderia nemoris]